ncbi:baseplate wedge subunit [Synechococcus phage S-SM2]|uniref:Baseplate wedge n=1 Tax=Synechococcus phage S-SM2 TaxID=444860 RepID=E3SIZ0_9CAUD|nr:baseplate wedge subunit [Synechococcus phage S-SM2]ADO97438.1 baseplate wedge [Synechococcus phage S-SM2]
MPLVNFSNLDFEQVKTSLKEYLKSNSNFTDYDFEGSNLSTIVDVLAYNTYITSYNANMVANEVFIDSATLRENIVALARNIGYVPRSRKAALATISFFVDATSITPTPATLTLKKGVVAASSGTFANQSFVFSILEDVTVPVFDGIASFDDLEIHEGVLLESNFTYSSANLNQRFTLPNAGIDTDLIRVTVKDNQFATAAAKYSLQDSLFEIDSDSKVYYIQEIEDERYELIFGDGVFGKALQEGNYITANYIVSNGDAANGISQFNFSGRLTYTRNSTEYNVTSGVSLVTPGVVSAGGENIETVESIKKFAPRIYATQNRALTANDYETLIPSKIYPETESISVFGGEELVPPQYGKVFISIKPKFGDYLPNLIKENIKLRLKKYSVAGIVPEILDLKYLYIESNTKVYYNTNLAPSSEFVSTLVQNNVTKYSESTELNKYGARFKYSKFLKVIDDSHESITSNITTVQMRRDLRVTLNALVEYAIGFGNAFYIKRMSGYNIKTSAFRVEGINTDVYISDLPNTDRETGELFLFSVPSINSTNPTIVRRNVGTINYNKGILTLNPINVLSGKTKDGQTIIEISGSPVSNDVIGLQDLYLQLQISDSTFETVVDEISSGLDPSASNYVVSSSYANGVLVRPGGRGSVPVAPAATATTTPTGRTAPVATVADGTATTTTTTTSPTTTTSTPSSGGSSGGGSYGY